MGDRVEKLSYLIRESAGRYNNEEKPVITVVREMKEQIERLRAELEQAEKEKIFWQTAHAECKKLREREKARVWELEEVLKPFAELGSVAIDEGLYSGEQGHAVSFLGIVSNTELFRAYEALANGDKE